MALVDLRKSREKTGLTPAQLEWLIRRGKLTAYQPGGPHGKLYVQESDLEQIMKPVQRGQNK